MFNEKAYRQHLSKYTKEQIIDLYIQKCYDEQLRNSVKGRKKQKEIWTSGYMEELNPDGTRKYPLDEGKITTYTYCMGCAEKEQKLDELYNKLFVYDGAVKELKEIIKRIEKMEKGEKK